jgi:hypothetical protein
MKLVEFYEYSQQAWKAVEEGKHYHYRYGQALFNILPEEFTKAIYLSDDDFFHWDNERWQEIDDICYSLCDDYKNSI